MLAINHSCSSTVRYSSSLPSYMHTGRKSQYKGTRIFGGAVMFLWQSIGGMYIPYCCYYKRVLILANIGDLVITAKFCARY